MRKRVRELAKRNHLLEGRVDALRAQVEAVAAALADKREEMRYYDVAAMQMRNKYVSDLRATVSDPARVLAVRDAEKWDEGYRRACLDHGCGEGHDHKQRNINPYDRG